MINLKSLKNDIPLPIRLFLGKALLLFVIWKIIYIGFLFDSKYLDHALTTHVGDFSSKVINSLGSMSGFEAKREATSYIYEGGKVDREISAIYHNDYVVLFIANVCNGLELMILYAGFIVCMPSSFWRKVRYVILGIIILDIINIIRCVGLIYLIEYYEVYFDFAHHYLFNAMVYTGTFIMWVFYCRKINLKNETI
ncbi:MAG: archaeosortase/exosortase family protein [Algibacter sp.]